MVSTLVAAVGRRRKATYKISLILLPQIKRRGWRVLPIRADFLCDPLLPSEALREGSHDAGGDGRVTIKRSAEGIAV